MNCGESRPSNKRFVPSAPSDGIPKNSNPKELNNERNQDYHPGMEAHRDCGNRIPRPRGGDAAPRLHA